MMNFHSGSLYERVCMPSILQHKFFRILTSILFFISPQVYNTKPDSSGQPNVTTLNNFDNT